METELAPLAASASSNDNGDGVVAQANEGGEPTDGHGEGEGLNEPREASLRQRRGGGGGRRFVPWVRSLFRAPEGADLSSGRVTAYGVGAISFSILADMPGFYLQAFLLQVAGVNPTASGTLLLVSKLFDAVVDPMIGAASDETRSTMGRRRPWMFWSIPCAFVSYILMWTVWPEIQSNEAAKFGYYLAMYCLSTFALAAFSIPYTAQVMTISSKDIDRIRLTTARAVWMIVGDIIGVIVITICGFVFEANGTIYLVGGAINAVIVSIAMLITVFFVPEPSSKDMPKHGFGKELKRFFTGCWSMLKSWTYMSLAILVTLQWLAIYFVQGNLVLYVEYALLLPDLFDIILLIALLSCVAFAPFWYWLLGRMSKRRVMALGNLWLCITWMLLWVGPPDNVPLAVIGAMLSGGGITLSNIQPYIMLADVIDADELEHGSRREGLLSSMFVFLNKVTIGISLAVSGFAIAAAGYDNSNGQEPPPTPELGFTMRMLCGIIPLGCSLLTFPFLYYYPITHAKHLEINRRMVELRKRRAEEASMAAGSTAALDVAGLQADRTRGDGKDDTTGDAGGDEAASGHGAQEEGVQAGPNEGGVASESDVSFGRGRV